MERTLHIVLHDVAPPTQAACCRVLDALDEVGRFPVTLLAVPRFHGAARDAGFERWLVGRAEGGDEIALHGYTHRDDGAPRSAADWLLRRVYTRSEGEFFALDDAEVRRRIDAGLAWLRALSLEPGGFVAPAWLMGEAAWRVLPRYAFSYTCTLRRFHLLPRGPGVICQSQVFSSSSAWRRSCSVAWNTALAARQRDARIVRLELHPHDADHREVRACWQRLLLQQLPSREVSTLQALAARLGGPLRTETAPIPP
jgi:uncharacterized protein